MMQADCCQPKRKMERRLFPLFPFEAEHPKSAGIPFVDEEDAGFLRFGDYPVGCLRTPQSI